MLFPKKSSLAHELHQDDGSISSSSLSSASTLVSSPPSSGFSKSPRAPPPSVLPTPPRRRVSSASSSKARRQSLGHSGHSSSSVATKPSMVKFDERRNEYYKVAANSDPRASKACWWNVEDLETFRAGSQLLAKKLAKGSTAAECSYRRVLTSVYTSLCSVDFDSTWSSTEDRSNENRYISLLCKADQLDMQKCISNSNSRLGLEQYVVRALREDTSARRKAMRRKVAQIQEESRSQNIPSQMEAELLRKALEPISRPNRLFALEKAQALAPESTSSSSSYFF